MSSSKKRFPPLLPRPSAQSTANDLARPTTELRKRRQAVTIACNNCKKRKTKCDGHRPRCGPCLRKDLDCEFVEKEDPTSRENDKRLLSTYQTVFELIRQGNHEESTKVVQRIRDADNVQDAANSIVGAKALMQMPAPNDASVLEKRPSRDNLSFEELHPKRRQLRSPQEDSNFMFEKQYMTDPRDKYVDSNMFVDVLARELPLSRWTTVSQDDRQMNHLLTMFFTRDNIVERAIYRPIFEEDTIAIDPHLANNYPRNFCSAFLVNALLAASCLYTLDPAFFKEPQDSSTRGRRWADEAETLLQKIETPSIPLLQGLYSLFVYEGVIGEGTKSVNYFLRAMDVYKELNDTWTMHRHGGADDARLDRERHAISWCLWGFYCCEWLLDSESWLANPRSKEPGLTMVFLYPIPTASATGGFRIQYVELSEIAEETLDFIYPEEGQLPPQANTRRALEIYDKYVAWKYSCPSRIRFADATVPSVILLHVGVEVMFTVLLRPFSHMSKQKFGRFDPKERCLAHAHSIMSTIWTFRSFAHIRFEYWLSHVTGTAAYIVLRDAGDSPVQMDTLIRACQCLEEMKVSFPIAIDVLAGISAAFRRFKVQIPSYMSHYFDKVQYRRDGLLHHAVAALLPSESEVGRIGSGAEVQLQELLDEFGDMGID
ncbi:unnamed protein product [Fusarium venenatum]|uniref:Zn(2)-C6 fungal-type domain-containing protein n=1 Tax=Fusarium venenatum TaxID=56646 RepID=A0A2L2SZ21_9HYPO|nr:uncharacterized protein FVRRES_04609 [Fusarium venenatum]CEI60173.1 unnamed protein product [Fusarium venenatum]